MSERRVVKRLPTCRDTILFLVGGVWLAFDALVSCWQWERFLDEPERVAEAKAACSAAQLASGGLQPPFAAAIASLWREVICARATAGGDPNYDACASALDDALARCSLPQATWRLPAPSEAGTECQTTNLNFDWAREGVRWNALGEILDNDGAVLCATASADTTSLFRNGLPTTCR